MSGYDKFFRDAQRATGVSTGKAPTKASKPVKKTKASGRGVQPAVQKPRFKLRHSASETPEQQLRNELASRVRDRKAKSVRKKQSFPVLPATVTMVALVLCAVGFHNSDQVDEWINKITSKIEIGAFGLAEASETPAPATAPAKPAAAAKKAEKPAETKAALGEHAEEHKAEPAKPTSTAYSAEEVNYLGKLNDRKKELDSREADLAKLEEELQKRKAELDEKLKSLEQMRGDISKTLKTRVATDQQKVEKLVEFYAAMKPAQASKVIETLNEDLAVEILDRLKKKSAAEILNAMSAKKARRLSELMTGYERSTASEVAKEETDPADLPAQDPKKGK